LLYRQQIDRFKESQPSRVPRVAAAIMVASFAEAVKAGIPIVALAELRGHGSCATIIEAIEELRNDSAASTLFGWSK